MVCRHRLLPIEYVTMVAQQLIKSSDCELEIDALELVAQQLEYVLLDNYHRSPAESFFQNIHGAAQLIDLLHDSCVGLIALLDLDDYESPCDFVIQGNDWVCVSIDYDYNAMYQDEYKTAV